MPTTVLHFMFILHLSSKTRKTLQYIEIACSPNSKKLTASKKPTHRTTEQPKERGAIDLSKKSSKQHLAKAPGAIIDTRYSNKK